MGKEGEMNITPTLRRFGGGRDINTARCRGVTEINDNV